MNSGEKNYIWNRSDWPKWRYDSSRLSPLLRQIHLAQGHLLGRLHDLGMPLRDQTTLRILTEDVLKTSEIEGEKLNLESVRSSIARRLGVDIGALHPSDRHVEGVVEMILDAASHANTPLTRDRLFSWHMALFPMGQSGLSKIQVGQLRDDTKGPMQVVSGPLHRQKVHFEAPPAHRLEAELSSFLNWFNSDYQSDPALKAGLAHLWFVTLHPFDDGNGRIARAISDMALTRMDQSCQRYYSMSAQIQRERNDYYDMLEATQKGSTEITVWLEWFLSCLLRSLQLAEETLSNVLIKTRYWQLWMGLPMNERQTKILNKLLDGFEGKLTSKKWAAIGKCSPDTALRDITDLIERGVLRKAESGGRSTSYLLCELSESSATKE